MNIIKQSATIVAKYGIFVALIILVATAAIVHDFRYVSRHPFVFALETLMVGIFPAMMYVMVVRYTRCIDGANGFVLFSFMAVHFAVFHALLQLSGAYERVL